MSKDLITIRLGEDSRNDIDVINDWVKVRLKEDSSTATIIRVALRWLADAIREDNFIYTDV